MAFAEEAAAPAPAAAVSTPSPSCAVTPLSPMVGAVQAGWCPGLQCSYDQQCDQVCGPFMCGGQCYYDTVCEWRWCHCLQCP
jgi:hypothetical protein